MVCTAMMRGAAGFKLTLTEYPDGTASCADIQVIAWRVEPLSTMLERVTVELIDGEEAFSRMLADLFAAAGVNMSQFEWNIPKEVVQHQTDFRIRVIGTALGGNISAPAYSPTFTVVEPMSRSIFIMLSIIVLGLGAVIVFTTIQVGYKKCTAYRKRRLVQKSYVLQSDNERL